MTGDEPPDGAPHPGAACRFCPDAPEATQVIAALPSAAGWSARSMVHPAPLYHIEGEPGRRGDGLYDRMNSVGAHEVLVENPRHDRHLWNASDDEIGHVPAPRRRAHPRSQARPAHQVRQSLQGLRTQRRPGIQPSYVAAHGDHVRSASRALRTAGRDANTSRQRSAASSATFSIRRSGRPRA